MLFWLRRYNALDWPAIDAIAPALVVGYFFGRGGCELSGDGCYGIPTDLPWGMAYPNGLVPTLDLVSSDADLRDDSDGLYFRDSVGSAGSSQAR